MTHNSLKYRTAPRLPFTERIDVGGEIYHVINRANGRLTIFREKEGIIGTVTIN